MKIQTLTVGYDAEAGEEGEGQEGGEGSPDATMSFEKQLAVAQAEAKKGVAMSFVRAMHLKGVGVGLDPALQAGEVGQRRWTAGTAPHLLATLDPAPRPRP